MNLRNNSDMNKIRKEIMRTAIYDNDIANSNASEQLTAYMKIVELPQYYGTSRLVVQELIQRIRRIDSNPSLIVEDIAKKIKLSKRSLQRHLKMQGETFSSLLDKVRRYYALHYLLEKNFTVHDTSRLLGFADRSGLSMAFKRWIGISPRELKKLFAFS